MTSRDTVIAEIAKRHLLIDTLETRNSDSEDFYEVAVWCIKAALLEAYVDIMKLRFGNSFQYYNVIPTDLYFYEIPAFTMQPIKKAPLRFCVSTLTKLLTRKFPTSRALNLTPETSAATPIPLSNYSNCGGALKLFAT